MKIDIGTAGQAWSVKEDLKKMKASKRESWTHPMHRGGMNHIVYGRAVKGAAVYRKQAAQ